MSIAEVGASEVGMTEVGAHEMGAAEVGTTEVSTAEIGADEAGMSQVDPAEAGNLLPRLAPSIPFGDSLLVALEQFEPFIAIHDPDPSLIPRRCRSNPFQSAREEAWRRLSADSMQ